MGYLSELLSSQVAKLRYEPRQFLMIKLSCLQREPVIITWKEKCHCHNIQVLLNSSSLVFNPSSLKTIIIPCPQNSSIYPLLGTFHAKMGSIKDRYGMDLTEAEDIKKRWQEYTETVQKRSSRPR